MLHLFHISEVVLFHIKILFKLQMSIYFFSTFRIKLFFSFHRTWYSGAGKLKLTVEMNFIFGFNTQKLFNISQNILTSHAPFKKKKTNCRLMLFLPIE